MMNPPDVLMVLGLAFLPVTGTLTTLWLSARRRAQKAEALVHQLAVLPALRGEQGLPAQQINQALDAIAVEVERISEGQRFAAKLLAERREPVGPGATPPRVITPH
jgi:hypothetical protein